MFTILDQAATYNIPSQWLRQGVSCREAICTGPEGVAEKFQGKAAGIKREKTMNRRLDPNNKKGYCS
jgi:malate synthase